MNYHFTRFSALAIIMLSCSTQKRVRTRDIWENDFHIRDDDSRVKPFQVINAEHVISEGSNALVSRKDFLHIDDTLHFDSNGFLLLIHHTGQVIEFDNDTILSLRKLDSLLLQGGRIDASSPIRANVSYFFDVLPDYGGYKDCYSAPIACVSPTSRDLTLHRDMKGICLAWNRKYPDTSRSTYQVM